MQPGAAERIGRNLRHLRVLLAAIDRGSATGAAAACGVTQPAVTQALARLERAAGQPLFLRASQGLAPTAAGRVLARRAGRALARLDAALAAVAPRLVLTATRPQLLALAACCEAEGFSAAARRLGVAQPTVHRAVAQLEREAGQPLVRRSPSGLAPVPAAAALAQAVRLAFAELDQAAAELGDLAGREVGRIVIGALPLSRSHVLPRALAAFRGARPVLPVTVRDGSHEALLEGLRRGEIDLMIGALRASLPAADVVQERLFDDTLVLLCGAGHPLLSEGPVTPGALARWPWLVARQGTPTRVLFDAIFESAGRAPPASLIETGSVILMREMVQDDRFLACVSRLQADSEIGRGLVRVLPFEVPRSRRPIGLTLRRGWEPTPAQGELLRAIRAAVAPAGAPEAAPAGAPEAATAGAPEAASAGAPEVVPAGAPEVVPAGAPEAAPAGAPEAASAGAPETAPTGAPEAAAGVAPAGAGAARPAGGSSFRSLPKEG